jgi:trehalose 6-phosphate phosphatase
LQHSPPLAARPTPADLLADDPGKYALFLDVDGTLVEIAPTPDDVVVPPGLAELVVRTAAGLNGALAIVTGRQLSEIDSLLTPAKPVGAGVHGTELRTQAGGPITTIAASIPHELIAELTELARNWPGVIVEPKGQGLAIHYRQAPALKREIEKELLARLESHRNEYSNDLVLCDGRKLFEIVPAGNSKGTALASLVELPQFRGRIPIMIGDDVGDEPAFAAAERLGGVGLRVGGEHFGHTNVDLDGPKDVVAWLTQLSDKLKG